jgi:hypothetical protein
MPEVVEADTREICDASDEVREFMRKADLVSFDAVLLMERHARACAIRPSSRGALCA